MQHKPNPCRVQQCPALGRRCRPGRSRCSCSSHRTMRSTTASKRWPTTRCTTCSTSSGRSARPRCRERPSPRLPPVAPLPRPASARCQCGTPLRGRPWTAGRADEEAHRDAHFGHDRNRDHVLEGRPRGAAERLVTRARDRGARRRAPTCPPAPRASPPSPPSWSRGPSRVPSRPSCTRVSYSMSSYVPVAVRCVWRLKLARPRSGLGSGLRALSSLVGRRPRTAVAPRPRAPRPRARCRDHRSHSRPRYRRTLSLSLKKVRTTRQVLPMGRVHSRLASNTPARVGPRRPPALTHAALSLST